MNERKNGKPETIVEYKSNPSNKELNEESFASTVKTYYSFQAARFEWVCIVIFSYVDAFRKLNGSDPSNVR